MPPRRSLSGHDKKRVAARQAWRCALCDDLLDETYEVDHVVPLHLGGADHTDNCRALCCGCHRRVTVAQEADRVARRRRAARSTSRFPPTVCVRCGATVSPYFRHACQARP